MSNVLHALFDPSCTVSLIAAQRHCIGSYVRKGSGFPLPSFNSISVMSSPSLSNQNGSQASPPVEADKRTQQPAPRVRRRNRLITSCLECRRRKLKCDKGHPCTHCTKNTRQCVFIASGLDANAQAKLAEVKEQMGRLERSLEEDVARKTEINLRNTASFSRVGTLPGQEQSSDQEDDEDTKDLRPTHLVTEDAAYYEPDDDVNDDMVDLGFRMGRVRITERIGGLVRPRLSDEVSLHVFSMSDHTDTILVACYNTQRVTRSRNSVSICHRRRRRKLVSTHTRLCRSIFKLCVGVRNRPNRS